MPAAVQLAKHLIQEVDFFSVGTNDLIQYTLAVDRNNPKVSRLYDPLHPAILQQLKDVADVCIAAGKPVSICGEMASVELNTVVLLGLGYRQLSINSASIPRIKKMIRSIDMREATEIANHVLTLSSAEQIREYLQLKGAVDKG